MTVIIRKQMMNSISLVQILVCMTCQSFSGGMMLLLTLKIFYFQEIGIPVGRCIPIIKSWGKRHRGQGRGRQSHIS